VALSSVAAALVTAVTVVVAKGDDGWGSSKVRVERILCIFCYFNSASKLKLLTALIPAGNSISTVAVYGVEVVVTNVVPAVAAKVRRDGILFYLVLPTVVN
jgi:hypothetical protein